MTECERIIKEGVLPKSFFEEEVRNDFLITTERKKVWAIELDLYSLFSKICDKNGLKYYLIGGALLGAVRHSGMIPWDDDIDVAMPRKDYEKLKNLSSSFQYPYFLQNSETDPEYGFSQMRLCNSNTTIVTPPLNYTHFNHGIYIDIFPLDKAYKQDYVERYNLIRKLNLINSANMRIDFPHKNDRDLEKIKEYGCKELSFSFIRKSIDLIASMYMECDDAQYVSTCICTIMTPDKLLYPKELFDDIEETQFEGIMVKIPKQRDKILKINYGNYLELPPIEKRGGWHNFIFDTDKSFEEFYSEKFDFKV